MNHTPSVSVRNIVLGEGIPKICIPLVSTCLDALLNDIKKQEKKHEKNGVKNI